MAEKISIGQLEAELANFYGTENYYKGSPLFPRFVYTDGVRFLAERVSAFWLLDLIFSHQNNKKVRDAEFQLWTLQVHADKTAVAMCQEDSGLCPIAQQKIEYTDFPVGEIKLYLIGDSEKVLLLPSEY